MSNTGSLGQGGSFDFNSQAGVMAVLAAVRLSQLSPAQKSELRDLVFLYANGGGDATVRRSLEQKIATYGLVPVAQGVKAARASTPAQPVRPYGNTRPSPQFSPVSISSENQSPAAPVAPKAAAVVPAPVAAPTPIPTPTPVPTPVPEAVIPPAPEPKPEPVQELVVTPPPSPAPAPVADPIPPAPILQGTSTPALDRIREIKSAVNQKVGNPVNLVDIDNAVGREYMMALLEAMKRVSGGAQGDVGQAMARLEAAYSAVEVAISLHNTTEHSAPAMTPVPAAVPIASPVSEPTPVVEAAPEPVSVPEPVSAPVSADTRWASGADAAPAPMPVAPQPTAFKAASLADDTERLLTPQDLPDAASLATSSVVGDPLFTKEVDAGLEQLLAEWTIFKKSGLFGTGPKGREHPLFKTLAKVTIPLILAGRYDGATQEIRQSVTDYMNGWRYEQGIIYEQEEMFEHYLRRVIRHIIDLQNRQKGA